MIFVFGSNLAGIHGSGAARTAFEKHGAVTGIGRGRYHNSYAIPTKNHSIMALPLVWINSYVAEFMCYADAFDLEFQVTRVGCGLAGYKDEQIAPMFVLAPLNCFFDEKWKQYLPPTAKFWGTFE